MEFKRAVIKQMLSEEIIIATSQLHNKMSSPIFPLPHHTKTLMRHSHASFAFVGTCVQYSLVLVKLMVTNKERNSGHTE